MSKLFGLRGAMMAAAILAVVVSAGFFGARDTAEAVSPCGPGATPCVNPNDVISIRHSGGNPGPYGGGSVLLVPVGGMFNAELWVDASSVNYQGYQWEIAYDPAYLIHTGTNTETQSGTYSLCAGAGAVPFGPFVIYGQGAGCLAPGPAPASFIGMITTIQMQCVNPTNVAPFATAVVLVGASPEDALNDPIFGTSLIDPGGALRPTSTRFKGPNPAGGNIAQIAVVCFTPADISIVKTDNNDPTVAPGVFQYTLTITNVLGNGPHTVNVSDTVPASLGTVTAASAPCTFVGNAVTCNAVALGAGAGTTTVLTIDVAATAANACASANNTATASLTTAGFGDVNPANNSSVQAHAIACTGVTIVKSATPNPVFAGSPVTFSYNVCNSAGSSVATNVVVTDSNAVLNPIVGSPIPSLAGGACVVLSGVTSFASAGTPCNTATADPGNGTQATVTSNQVCVVVLPLFNGIIKDAEPLVNGFQTTDNVWICKPLGGDIAGDDDDCGEATFLEIANGANDIDTCNDDDDGDGLGCNRGPGADGICGTADDVSASTDWDGDLGDLEPCDATPDEGFEGLGAFEFQIKFDHKLFQHPDIQCSNDGVLDDTGRTVMGTVDVITENWVLVGCVSKANADGDATPGEPGDYPDPGPSISTGANLLVSVTFEIQPDLLQRIRPTKDNGVRTDLLDENCELADTLGSPYNLSVETNGSNDSTAGGLTDDCGDLTLTIRMLEGDIDLDCDVDVVDDQSIAFRYGATFGVLAYDKFFDLEPNTTPADFDVDIKDLQFVFGRNGSTCAAPIPPQLPQPQIPDP